MLFERVSEIGDVPVVDGNGSTVRQNDQTDVIRQVTLGMVTV
jgi:hypothetical protein